MVSCSFCTKAGKHVCHTYADRNSISAYADTHLYVWRHAPLRMETRTSTSADTHLYVCRHAPLRMETRTSTSADTQLCVRAYAHHTEHAISVGELNAFADIKLISLTGPEFPGRIVAGQRLLSRYPFHPRVTAVARKTSRQFSQKCGWQVTAKHTCVCGFELSDVVINYGVPAIYQSDSVEVHHLGG